MKIVKNVLSAALAVVCLLVVLVVIWIILEVFNYGLYRVGQAWRGSPASSEALAEPGSETARESISRRIAEYNNVNAEQRIITNYRDPTPYEMAIIYEARSLVEASFGHRAALSDVAVQMGEFFTIRDTEIYGIMITSRLEGTERIVENMRARIVVLNKNLSDDDLFVVAIHEFVHAIRIKLGLWAPISSDEEAATALTQVHIIHNFRPDLSDSLWRIKDIFIYRVHFQELKTSLDEEQFFEVTGLDRKLFSHPLEPGQ